MAGKLIVFEGTDGSGKATQTALLCGELDRRGIPYRRLEFPRYSEDSSALIRLYLGGGLVRIVRLRLTGDGPLRLEYRRVAGLRGRGLLGSEEGIIADYAGCHKAEGKGYVKAPAAEHGLYLFSVPSAHMRLSGPAHGRPPRVSRPAARRTVP